MEIVLVQHVTVRYMIVRTYSRCRRSRAENEREWTRDIWNKWFDQVYPPTPAESDWESEEEEEEEEDLFLLKEEEKPG